jgi:hypothetical protein
VVATKIVSCAQIGAPVLTKHFVQPRLTQVAVRESGSEKKGEGPDSGRCERARAGHEPESPEKWLRLEDFEAKGML